MTTPNARLKAKCEGYVPKSKVEEFRQHAEACIQHAEECTEPSDKERWLKIAESWLERAREEESDKE
jgi:hypothetical protein